MVGDSEHEIIDCPEIADVELHRFVNCRGIPCSAIYIDGKEKFYAPRDKENEMIAAYHWKCKKIEETKDLPFMTMNAGELDHFQYINSERDFDIRHEEINITEGKWFLQHSKRMMNDWRISGYDDCPNATYYLEVKTPDDIINWLGYLNGLRWVDIVKVFEAVMPAIRYFYHHPQTTKKRSKKC